MRLIEFRFNHRTPIDLLPPKYQTEEFRITSGIELEAEESDGNRIQTNEIDFSSHAILTEEEFFDLYQFGGIVRVLHKGEPASPKARPSRKIELHLPEWLGDLVRRPDVTHYAAGGQDVGLASEVDEAFSGLMSQFEEANGKGPFMVVYEPQPRADISKVDAIKALRSLTGWLLMDSKRAIEHGFRYDAKDRGSQVAMINQLAQFGVKCTKG